MVWMQAWQTDEGGLTLQASWAPDGTPAHSMRAVTGSNRFLHSLGLSSRTWAFCSTAGRTLSGTGRGGADIRICWSTFTIRGFCWRFYPKRLTTTYSHIHTPMPKSTTQDSQLLRSCQGEVPCSGTPRHSARRWFKLATRSTSWATATPIVVIWRYFRIIFYILVTIFFFIPFSFWSLNQVNQPPFLPPSYRLFQYLHVEVQV